MQTLWLTLQDGMTLRAFRVGSGTFPVVLLHGFTDSALSLTTVIDHLAPRADVIAYDARGHGGSGRLRATVTVQTLVDDALGVLDGLELARVGIVAHSLGAATAFLLAVQHPQRVAWLVMEDPPFYLTPPPQTNTLQEWKTGIALLQAMSAEEMLTYYRTVQYPRWGDADLVPRVQARRDLDSNVFDLIDFANTPDWRAYAPQLVCPSLLITGEVALGGLVTPEAAAHLQTLAPNVQVAQIAGAGHQIRCEMPDAYFAALDAFIAPLLKETL